MIDGRDNGVVAAIYDVHKPITIVLDQRQVALRKGAFWREQAHRHRKLQQGNDESREQRSEQPTRAGHYIIIAARSPFVRESPPVGRTRPAVRRASFCSRDSTVSGKRQRDRECNETTTVSGSFGRGNLGSHCFQNVYAGVNRSFTADARLLFARATLPADYFLPPWQFLSPNFPSLDYYEPEMTRTISPFGGWAS